VVGVGEMGVVIYRRGQRRVFSMKFLALEWFFVGWNIFCLLVLFFRERT